MYGKVCAYGKSAFTHVRACNRDDCTYPRCDLIKNILRHHLACKVRAGTQRNMDSLSRARPSTESKYRSLGPESLRG